MGFMKSTFKFATLGLLTLALIKIDTELVQMLIAGIMVAVLLFF